MVHMWKEELWEGEELDPYNFHVKVGAWENEGGRPKKMDADWEPSESEVLTINVQPKLSSAQMQYFLTCLISDGIRHVRKYFFTRAEAERNSPQMIRNPTTVHPEPTIAQQVGEFVTVIRRLFRENYQDLAESFRDLTNTDMWSNVGVPNPKYDHRWRFGLLTTNGLFQMTLPLAQTLCENAHKMATSDKTSEEEFREINNGLNNLMREQVALDSLIFRAKDLNAQASVVVDNLCTIAEKLQECQ